MAITKHFRDTVLERASKDIDFRREMLRVYRNICIKIQKVFSVC